MNYPIKVKKAFSRMRYSAHDIWQNLKELKRNISSLVRNIDNVGECVSRNRRLLQGIPAHKAEGEAWASCPLGDQT